MRLVGIDENNTPVATINSEKMKAGANIIRSIINKNNSDVRDKVITFS